MIFPLNFMKNKLWFKAKCYGWGWYPCSCEGWLILAAFCALFLPLMHFIAKYEETMISVYAFIGIFVLVGVLLLICYAKGEKPRWRWGK